MSRSFQYRQQIRLKIQIFHIFLVYFIWSEVRQIEEVFTIYTL